MWKWSELALSIWAPALFTRHLHDATTFLHTGANPDSLYLGLLSLTDSSTFTLPLFPLFIVAIIMVMALVEFGQRLRNIFKLHSSKPSVDGTHPKVVVKQETSPDPIFESEGMSGRSTENYRVHTTSMEETESEDLSDIDVKKENLVWGFLQSGEVPHATADDEGFEGWSRQELDFFNAINDRGQTPMLWVYWRQDFPMIPRDIFTTQKEEALIKNWGGLPARGAKALNALVLAGMYARERRHRGQEAAVLLTREINRYIKWSVRDAGWKTNTYIPLIYVNCARRKESLAAAEARGQAQLKEIGQQYRELWGSADPPFEDSLPTLFHIFLAKTAMGFETYDLSAEEPEFRTIYFTDWKQLGHDIWNAMAVAILVEQCRIWLKRVNPKKPMVDEKEETDQDL